MYCIIHTLFDSSCSVRCVSGEERMQLKIHVAKLSGVMRQFNMDRLQLEPLESTIARLQTKVSTVLIKKKSKKKKQAEQIPEEESTEQLIPVGLFYDDSPVDVKLSNKEAWLEGSVLQIGDAKCLVEVNPPTVSSIVLSGCLMAGYMTSPKIESEFTNIDKSTFIWYRLGCGESDTSDNLSIHYETDTSKPTMADELMQSVLGGANAEVSPKNEKGSF